jgi:hypothetical protein
MIRSKKPTKSNTQPLKCQKAENVSPKQLTSPKHSSLKLQSDFNHLTESAHRTYMALKTNCISNENLNPKSNLYEIQIESKSQAIKYGMHKIDFTLANNNCNLMPTVEPTPTKKQTLNDYLYDSHCKPPNRPGSEVQRPVKPNGDQLCTRPTQDTCDYFLKIINASLNSDASFYLHEAFNSNKHLIIEANLNKYELYDLFVKILDMRNDCIIELFTDFVDDHIRMNRANHVVCADNPTIEEVCWANHLNMLNDLVVDLVPCSASKFNAFECYFKLIDMYFVDVYAAHKLNKNEDANGWEFMQKSTLRNDFCIDNKFSTKLFMLFETLVVNYQNGLNR